MNMDWILRGHQKGIEKDQMRTDDDKYKKLLDDIIDPARTYPRLKGEVFSLQAFAKFLSKLARDAGEQTEKNLVIQRRLVGARAHFLLNASYVRASILSGL